MMMNMHAIILFIVKHSTNFSYCSDSKKFLCSSIHKIIYNFRSLLKFKIPPLNYLYFKYIKINKYHLGRTKSIFNDPDLRRQWYFVKEDFSSYFISHQLDYLWEMGIKGLGVTIGLIGGGIETSHKDLTSNYNRIASFNFALNSFDKFMENKSKLTESAGLISAVADNNHCGVGAAPLSKFSNLQVFIEETQNLNSNLIKKAMIHAQSLIQIYLLSFDVHQEIDKRRFSRQPILSSARRGYIKGRKGLGSIYVMGSGNQKKDETNCAFNGILQIPEILVFGTISYNGSSLMTIQACTAILAASIGGEYEKNETSLYSTSAKNTCGNSIGGSYSSSAISAGILALLISLNPALTVRQIIFLIIFTSIQYDESSILNYGGFYYSYYFGFGMLNAISLMEMAVLEDIKHIAPEHICSALAFLNDIHINMGDVKILYIYISGCLDTEFCITEIEQTFISFTFLTRSRNTISLYLTSPSGTRFHILKPRRFDYSHNGFHNWKLKIMGFFGEKPLGVWKFEIHSTILSARLLKIELILHGTCLNPEPSLSIHNMAKNYIISRLSNDSFFPISYAYYSNKSVNQQQYRRDMYSVVTSEDFKLEFINTLI